MQNPDQNHHVGDTDSENDVEYLDDELLEQMDQMDNIGGQESDDDFATMKESEIADEDQMLYGEGQVLAENLYIQSDYVCQLSLVHQDHVYCVAQLPHQPFNTFVSGDGNDKCFIWSILPQTGKEGEEEGKNEDGDQLYDCVPIGELEGHTETVEFIRFNHDGKLCLTGGMNNQLRVWQVEDNEAPLTKPYKMSLKCKIENGPDAKDDILFVDWHPKGNAIICGGKDYMIWLMNAATGDYLASFSGHEADILMAKFTTHNNGKLIVSSSADLSIRVWSPIK
jgi:ribosome assembly protein SQT1